MQDGSIEEDKASVDWARRLREKLQHSLSASVGESRGCVRRPRGSVMASQHSRLPRHGHPQVRQSRRTEAWECL